MTDEKKNVQTPPPARTASAIGLYPTLTKLLGCPGTRSLPSTIRPPHVCVCVCVFYLFIWWCETTEGFIDSHFDVKDSNIFSVAMGLIIFLLLGAALQL